MKPVIVVSMLLCAVPAFADPCPSLSVADAKALTRAQLEERVCKYLRTVQSALAVQIKGASPETESTANAVASHCIARAQEVEDLYEERFGGKVSKCMRPGAPELVPPKKP